MSHHIESDAGPYGSVPLWVIQSGVSDGAIATYALMWAKWVNYSTKKCWPSHASIASERMIAERTIIRHISELEQVGAIRVENRNRDDGSTTSNHYTMVTVPPDKFVTPPGHQCHGGGDTSVMGGVTPVSYELNPVELDPENDILPSSSPSALKGNMDDLRRHTSSPQNDIDKDAGGSQDPGGGLSYQAYIADKEVSHTHAIDTTWLSEAYAIVSEQYGEDNARQVFIGTRDHSTIIAPWALRTVKESYPTEVLTESVRLAVMFSEHCAKAGNTYPNPFTKNACKTMRLLMQNDERPIAQIETLIAWTFQDTFWDSNVQAHSGLRSKWDKLRGARNRDVIKRREQRERDGGAADGTTEEWMVRSAHSVAS